MLRHPAVSNKKDNTVRKRPRDRFSLYASARKRDLQERAHRRAEKDKEGKPFVYNPLYDPPDGEWDIFTLCAALVLALPLKGLDLMLMRVAWALHYRELNDIFDAHAWWRDPEACIADSDEARQRRWEERSREQEQEEREYPGPLDFSWV